MSNVELSGYNGLHTPGYEKALQIHTLFSKSQYKQPLDHIVRWSRFKPSRISDEKWINTLGADMRDTTHLLITLGMTDYFIRKNGDDIINSHEKELLLLLAIMHDWPEAELGDIPLPDKKKNEEANGEQERSILRRMISEIIPTGELQDEAQEAASYLNKKDTPVGRAFDAIEQMGYLRAAHIAGMESSQLDGKDEELQKQLMEMHQTKTNSIAVLRGYEHFYPAVPLFFSLLGITDLS